MIFNSEFHLLASTTTVSLEAGNYAYLTCCPLRPVLNISFPDRSHLPNEKLPEVHDVDPEETDEVVTLAEHKLPDFSTAVFFNEINFD